MSLVHSSGLSLPDLNDAELGARSQRIESTPARQQWTLEGVHAMRPPRQHRERGRQVCPKELLVVAIVSYTITDILMNAVRSLAPPFSSTKGLERRLVRQGQFNLSWALREMPEDEKKTLQRSIKPYSFQKVKGVLQEALKLESEVNKEHVPLGMDDVLAVVNRPVEKADAWNTAGLKLISQGQVGVLLLAGGQGTRLGSSDPKGCFSIGLPSKKSLFQLHAERILRLQQLAEHFNRAPAGSCKIMFYILTSDATHSNTVDFFSEHAFFGLQRSQLFFFQQASMPCLTIDGEAIIQDDGTIATAPDGNGGVYLALHNSGALRHMRSNSLVCIDCCSIDNAAARLGDPMFIGACSLNNADLGARTVAKASPEERVGVFARRNGKLEVVEYSEISSEQAAARDTWGRLQYNWSNVCMHYFSVAWLTKVVKHLETQGARYHIARKQIPSRDGPVQGIKLEQFIFDVFNLAESPLLVEVRRTEEFAPVKNADGPGKADCPATARKLLMTLHKKWVEDAGGKVEGGIGGGVEVSPLASYAGEGLVERCAGERFRKNMVIE